MTKLHVLIEVPDVFEPVLTDPHEVAEEMVDTYNEWAQANGKGYEDVKVVRARWSDS